MYEVLPPYGVPTIEILQPVPRLDTLEGKTICGVMGAHFHFDQTWPAIAELLQKKYPTAKFVGPEEFAPGAAKPGQIHGDPSQDEFFEALPDRLKEYGCDAVVSGNGC